MPFKLAKTFAPTYKLKKPTEDADDVTLTFAQWVCDASVEVSNEAGKEFQIGFVQVLYECEMVNTYETKFLKRTVSPLPILDSDLGMFPWYDDDLQDTPKVQGTAGTVTAQCSMGDAPEHGFPWYEIPGAPGTNPLINIRHRMKFKTWLVVRDITGGARPRRFAAVLAQFGYVVEASFNVVVTNPLGQRCTFATGSEKANKPEMIAPPTPIHDCVWKDVVANSSCSDTWSPRPLVKSSTGPVGQVNTGVSVRDLARKFGG